MKQGCSINFMPNSGYAEGREKIEPFVIGKSKNPRYFKHFKSFDTKYAHYKKSCLTSSLFKNHLYYLDRAMRR